MGFADGSVDTESTCNAGGKGDAGLILVLGRFPRGWNGNLLHYSCLRTPWTEVGYSSQGGKDLDMTEYMTHVSGD